MHFENGRRTFLRTSTVVGAGLMLAGCGNTDKSADKSSADKEKKEMGEVTATEDLMREHGVLRRALLVYSAAASRLHTAPAGLAPDALLKTAKLFRAFGEDYHERSLEEAFIFPAVKQAGGPAASMADILLAQHQRGREITDYILATATAGSKFGAANQRHLRPRSNRQAAVMPNRRSALSVSASSAFRFVLVMGAVNLFADMTYEGGASINGPFLGSLGASAAGISVLAGLGEFLGYSIRSVSDTSATRPGSIG